MSDRQKLFLALVASALFHLALGLLLASWTARHDTEAERARPDLSQLTVTVMPAKPAPAVKTVAAAAVPTPPPRIDTTRPVMDSDGLTKSTKVPARALFQSDANMVAGSLLPATGNVPLPSEAGPKRHFMDFADRAGSFGKGEAPSEAATRARQAAQAQAAKEAARAAEAAKTALAAQSPAAVTQVQESATPPPRIAQATPKPAPMATPKPAPSAAPDTLALGKPTPAPAPSAAALPTPMEQLAKLTAPPTLRANAEMAPMTRPAQPSQSAPPAPSLPEPAMQRETERTKIDGGITAPGAPGVDAEETPFGRYHHKLYNLIGSRWKLYLQEHPTDVGDVTILVMLNTNGKVAGTRVLNNNAVDDLAEVSTRAIMESDLPPVPDDLAPMLRNGKLEISFSFSVYDPSHDSPSR